MEENQVARESPTKLRDRSASISYYLISYSRTTLSYYESSEEGEGRKGK
jgi:hypothetical protein